MGKGVRFAIEAGLQSAHAPVAVVMMADVSDDFAKVEEMVRRAEADADVVCASRYMKWLPLYLEWYFWTLKRRWIGPRASPR